MQGIHYFELDGRITFLEKQISMSTFDSVVWIDNQLTSYADTYAAVHPQE